MLGYFFAYLLLDRWATRRRKLLWSSTEQSSDTEIACALLLMMTTTLRALLRFMNHALSDESTRQAVRTWASSGHNKTLLDLSVGRAVYTSSMRACVK